MVAAALPRDEGAGRTPTVFAYERRPKGSKLAGRYHRSRQDGSRPIARFRLVNIPGVSPGSPDSQPRKTAARASYCAGE